MLQATIRIGFNGDKAGRENAGAFPRDSFLQCRVFVALAENRTRSLVSRDRRSVNEGNLSGGPRKRFARTWSHQR